MDFRIEHDMLGNRNIDDSKYYGIHTERAMENFNLGDRYVNIDYVKEIAIIKKDSSDSEFKA